MDEASYSNHSNNSTESDANHHNDEGSVFLREVMGGLALLYSIVVRV